jgi:arsenate reductase
VANPEIAWLLLKIQKEFKIINYLINPPTFDELSVVIEKLQLDPLDLVRQRKNLD